MHPARPVPSGHPYQAFGRRFLPLLCALVAWSCGQTSVTELSGPDPVRCQVTLASDTRTVPADGGVATVNVESARDCTWAASSDASWATLSTTSGQGSGAVRVTVATSQLATVRTAGISVNNERVEIAQEGRPCQFALSSSRADIGGAGGQLTLTVTTNSGCSWRAVTNDAWLNVGSEQRSGTGTVSMTVAPNTGATREGSVTIADQVFIVVQSPAGGGGPSNPPNCTATLQPASLDVAATASTEPVRVEIGSNCDWSASSAAGWLTIASETTGRGNATVRIAIAQNTGAARIGTVTIARQQLMVRQAAGAPPPEPCTFSIDSASRNIDSAGGEARVQVTANRSNCEWTTSSNANWVTVTPSRASGSNEARYTVQPNASTSSRTATLTIAGRSHAVVQAGATCTYTIEPAAASIPVGGGPGQFRVTTQPGCTWSTSGGATWITITAGSGNGSGDVAYTVAPNNAEARSATIAAGGRTHSVTQAGTTPTPPTCNYTLTPPSRTFPAGVGQGQFRVVTQAGCTWSASAGAGWVTINSGTGPGEGDVVYTVQANTATEPRQTTIAVAGQVHSITQEGATPACTYTLNPTSSSIGSNGGEGRFAVSTQPNCPWSTSGGAAWLTITAGAGNGPGEVVFTAQPNGSTDARSATINVGNQSHQISQAGAAPTCTYTLNPQAQTIAAAGGQARFSVSTQPTCVWSASGGAGWITFTSGSGTGPGEVVFTVQQNTATTTRAASIAVGNQTHTITQDAQVCTYSISSTTAAIGAGAGEGRFTVTTQPNCAWSASGGASWLTITTGSGNGTGDVVYSAQANTATESRSASISVAGHSHTVTQAGATPTPPPPSPSPSP